MAALRYAARRLGDHALQRLQQVVYTATASASAGQRRLLQTVVQTCSRRAASSRPATAKLLTRNTTELHCAKPQLDGKQKERLVRTHLAKIQKKKEEMYSLITELDKALPNRCTKVNRQLATDLSVQVEPKPNDPRWRWYRGAKRANDFVLYGAPLSLSYMALSEGFQNCAVQKH